MLARTIALSIVLLLFIGSALAIVITSTAKHIVVLYRATALASTDDDAVPVLVLHGMGDAGSNPGMQRLCQTAADAAPGVYVVCASVADGLRSLTATLSAQTDELAAFVRADPRLARGFHAVGLSQGGLVLRGYIERIDEPPIRRLVSICAPHGGVLACPDSPAYRAVCPLWRIAPYAAPLAFADYWKGADRTVYLSRSRWLADVNNDRAEKSEAYRQRLASLERYVLVEALNDTTVVPSASAQHADWDAASDKNAGSVVIFPLRETEGYRGDWIGLRTLDEAGKLFLLSFEGDRISPWGSNIGFSMRC